MIEGLSELSGCLSTSYYSSYLRVNSGAVLFLVCLPAHPENTVENAWRKETETSKAGINSGSRDRKRECIGNSL